MMMEAYLFKIDYTITVFRLDTAQSYTSWVYYFQSLIGIALMQHDKCYTIRQ